MNTKWTGLVTIGVFMATTSDDLLTYTAVTDTPSTIKRVSPAYCICVTNQALAVFITLPAILPRLAERLRKYLSAAIKSFEPESSVVSGAVHKFAESKYDMSYQSASEPPGEIDCRKTNLPVFFYRSILFCHRSGR